MENEIYQILKKHKLPLKKREEVLADLLLLLSVSGRSELLFAFIKAIKEEFADQNWDYLDFIADRVIGNSC